MITRESGVMFRSGRKAAVEMVGGETAEE